MGDGAAGAAGAAAGAGGAAAGATAGAGAAAGGAAAPWYADKVDDVTIGLWKNKGIDPADPVAVATKLTEFYRNAERHIGAPPEEMLRIPKSNAAEADIRAYWNKIGVPMEAKDYDLSAVKFTDGKELDSGLVDVFRAAAHASRVPKDQAAPMLTALVKHMEANDAAELAEKTATVKAEREALDRNWGTNKAYNEAVAKRTLEELGRVAGLTAEQTSKAWDALSTVGGIGASYAMEMLRTIGAKTGEGKFIGPDVNNPDGKNGLMSKSQALAEIESLKKDRSFYERLVVKKEAAAKRQWEDLHKIAYAA